MSSISGFYSYLVARGDTPVRANPVPRGLSTRRRGGRRQPVPLVRVPRTLPKILSPAEVNALVAALRTDRDRAMVFAMVLGGLRRCEVLGLTLGDIQVPERSLFVAEGKGANRLRVMRRPLAAGVAPGSVDRHGQVGGWLATDAPISALSAGCVRVRGGRSVFGEGGPMASFRFSSSVSVTCASAAAFAHGAKRKPQPLSW